MDNGVGRRVREQKGREEPTRRRSDLDLFASRVHVPRVGNV